MMNRVSNGNAAMAPCESDKSKDWQLEILMEKLRSKTAQYKTLPEISKNVRMTMLDKRYALDSVEKSQHQKCLDTLQQSMKVTSLQSMVERLESLTRQLGLKFVVGPSDVQLFISSDMFYLEILLDTSGAVQDVKVHHEGKMEQQSCAELVSCLSRGDFQDFTAQLEGFASIYQLNAEKKVKSKAFTALQSLETDLSTLAQLHSFLKEPFNSIYKSPVGILEKRKGGHPMKLTYFISPYDLINISKGELEPISAELISSKNLGYSVTVCMEGSAAHKLQTTTLITVSRTMNGKSSPSFAPLSGQNSSVIPATFVLKLNKPLPMCVALARQLQVVTELEWLDFTNRRPLLDLIVSQCSNGKMRSENNRGLFVNLPDQNHCYFMTDNKNVEGILVNSIPFTHPTKVAQILVLLRQQALFNTLISSCVRPKSQQTFENVFMIEITALSWTHISISLEHPTEESMATAEMDLSDISRLTCKIHTPGTPPPPNAPDKASELVSRVLNKSFSIPVMIRSIIQFWERQSHDRRNHFGLGSNGHENFSLPLDSCDPGGGSGPKGGVGGPGGGNLPEFEGLDGGGGNRVKQELCHTQTSNAMQREMFLNESLMSNPNFQNFPSSEGVLELLGAPGNEKSTKRGQKRSRSGEDSWRSKSRKAGDEDVLLESSNSSDSTSGSTFLSHQDATDLVNSNSASLGFQSDLELSTMDSSELGGMEKNVDSDREDTEEEMNEKFRQNSEVKSPMDMLSDLNDKNLVPSNVSITPISNTASPSYVQGLPERRSSIELSSMSPSTSSLIPSTITITPLPQVKSSSDDKYKERKSSKSKSDEKSRMEKKRKRKRDESPMGPPEKIPPKQDPLSKPVSVSIKPSESPPPSLSTPSSPGILKYSASPTHRSLSGKLSPSLAKQSLKGHHSPKHSPAHVPSSPKHGLGISSPKSHDFFQGTSPKHPSASGSGKPSMSTLKNATNSPNSKSESKTKSGLKESSRDKEKKQSSTFQSTTASSKNKSSSKTKTTDSNFNTEMISPQENQIAPGGASDSSGNLNQARRKGMLSAIVDKLKSAQHCESGTDLSGKINNRLERDRSSGSSQISKSGDSKNTTNKSGDPKNSEYMVKPSSDGIKLTINKTRTKDAVKNAATKTGSPKVHTGLKPGVNSGPASKKPQQQQLQNQKSSSSVSSSSMPTSSKNSPKLTLSSPKSTSVASSLSSSNKSSKASASGQTKDRISKLGKSSSEKSVFSSRERGKSSPTPKDEPDTAFKYNSSLKMEGLVKQLDKNFQIPKLSARMGSAQMEDKKSGSKENPNNLSRSPSDSKIYDLMPKGDSKYPLAIPNNKILESMESKMRNNLNSITQNPSMLNRKDEEDESGRRDPLAISYPISNSVANKTYGTGFPSTDQQPLSLSMKTAMDLAKFAAPDAPRDKRETKKGSSMADCDILLDFSKGSAGAKTATAPYPPSPSVSVHIVKSPAPHPSPRAISPDELMDETFVGLGK
ncbi:mediator of RNA polymerase II transcription subunit 1 isoform X2 [Coccinella septempunctata]|uniref:mediator of RNA polymerase II transcription subunit 1 isoform X2 n=1 Tax=Coccinella septempunctata TaxID=41139 RepID=UPI001D087148|nr:mediator of RNA polymerase II transcription subunit 1 isoform X2 [Coccinella septempunctata]